MSSNAPDPDMVEAITDALESGQKIQAIKIYRDATGKGLKEAKEFVEQLIPSLIEKDPDRFAALNPKGAGCAAGVALLATFATCWALLLSRV